MAAGPARAVARTSRDRRHRRRECHIRRVPRSWAWALRPHRASRVLCMAGIPPKEGSDMRNVLRLLQGGALITFGLGAVLLAGCSATASESDATVSAALTAAPTPNGASFPAVPSTRTAGIWSARSSCSPTTMTEARSRSTASSCTDAMVANPPARFRTRLCWTLTRWALSCPQTLPRASRRGQAVVLGRFASSSTGLVTGTSAEPQTPLTDGPESTTDASGVVLAKIARDCKAIVFRPTSAPT